MGIFLAAQVLEPIFSQACEWERLIDVYEVMVAHSDDPIRKVELLHTIAQIYERQLEKSNEAFDAFARALREEHAKARKADFVVEN